MLVSNEKLAGDNMTRKTEYPSKLPIALTTLVTGAISEFMCLNEHLFQDDEPLLPEMLSPDIMTIILFLKNIYDIEYDFESCTWVLPERMKKDVQPQNFGL